MLACVSAAEERYEIIDGELFVTPAPYLAHQIVVGELYARLRDYLRAKGCLSAGNAYVGQSPT